MRQLLDPLALINLQNQVHLEWEIDTDEDLSGYSIVIKKANSPTETFKEVAILPIDTVSWDDVQSDLFLKWNENYYKIGLKNGGEEFEFPDLIEVNPEPDPVVLEIERRLRLVLEMEDGNGVECYFLKRRHKGKKCDECWNEARSVQKSTHCNICYDTSFIGGYYKAIPGYVTEFSLDDITRKRIWGNEANDITILITAKYCILKEKDIILIEHSNERYEIISSEHSIKGGWKFPSQFLTVQLLPRKHIIYGKEINV